MPDDEKKPELSLLGESSGMTDDQIVEQLMQFIEGKAVKPDKESDN